uniref:MULE transposase domain-containing protein n=1 Tax=Cacopsylla melanoneura TaxID=428564 RepID=A0A8D9ESL2_9HEMI
MTGKSQAAYETVLRCVANHVPDFVPPGHIMSDFETAIRTAIFQVWSTTRFSGCWFHYAQVSFILQNACVFIGDGSGHFNDTECLQEGQPVSPSHGSDVQSECANDFEYAYCDSPVGHQADGRRSPRHSTTSRGCRADGQLPRTDQLH